MIFEVKRDEADKIYYLFGKKIYRRRNLRRQLRWKMARMGEALARLEKSNSELRALLRCNLVPAALPPAQGWLRDIQLGILRIMKEIDRICTREGITYWLDAGTALGAVRHGGFIPWDDDGDLGMLRHDMERFLEVYQQEKSPEIRVWRYNDRMWSMIKIELAEIPSVCVDIFAYDFYNGAFDSIEERKKLTEIAYKMRVDATLPTELQEKLQFFAQMTEELKKNHPAHPSTKPDIFIGLEFLPWFPSSIFFPYEAMLPTVRVPFEDTMLCVPHDPHVYLSYFYGDYMLLPQNPSSHHSNTIQNMDLAKSLALKKYISAPENK